MKITGKNIKRLWLAVAFVTAGLPNLQAQKFDLTNVLIVSPAAGKVLVEMPARVLKEEIYKRTGIEPKVIYNLRPVNQARIMLLPESALTLLPAALQGLLKELSPTGKDGYKLLSDASRRLIIITGKDARSILYGVGKLLRKMEIRPGSILLPAPLALSSTPVYPVRGHQLGYRPKTNSYDAFSVAQYDQYIRELALFGANSIEIVPPRTDDEPTSRHMKLDPLNMIAEQSRICKSYGLDVWMWYPNMGADYTDRKTLQAELDERDTVFSAVKKLDNLFVPGGDPGELEPDILFAWLEKEAVVLHKYHPHARIWVSPQVFRPTQKWMDAFYTQVNHKYPWFGGVVFGPWIETPVARIRELVDPSIPIRMYPDITHSLSAQFPVPDWDLAYAMTLGRECINPRPADEKHIHNTFARYGNGSISYSEGTNDDVNKFIWSDQDWDPQTPVVETLQDYARLFIGADYAKPVAEGILSLEDNLRGPLLSNSRVGKTLDLFRHLEQNAAPAIRQNFRFQQCLLRAYYDAFIQRRLARETITENRIYDYLKAAYQTGSGQSITKIDSLLEKERSVFSGDPWRQKCMDLADSLFKSIGAQLTIKKHGAADGRGNFIDNIDVPLNDVPWITSRLQQIRGLKSEAERLSQIDTLLHRTDPGDGGIYTNFGTPSARQYVLPGMGWEKDPGGLRSPMVNFGVGTKEDEWVHEILPKGFGGQTVPKAWMTQTGTLYECPLQISYGHLDRDSAYRIRIAYTGRFRSTIKLTANGYLVHDNLQTGDQPIYEFEIPPPALTTGNLILTFSCPEGEQGPQVGEIWILKMKKNKY